MTYLKLTTNAGTTMINVSMVCGIVQYEIPSEEALQPPYNLFAYDIHMSSGTIFTTKETDKIQEIMGLIWCHTIQSGENTTSSLRC